MENPIPDAVRRWLYLAGAVIATIAVGNVVPPEYLPYVLVTSAILNLLAAANVPTRAAVLEEEPEDTEPRRSIGFDTE